MKHDDTILRRAEEADLIATARLAGRLVRMHHAVDPSRFFLPPNVEEGYASWFRQELARPSAVVLVAVRSNAIIGYAYGRLEERDWNLLLDRHGAFHDLFVAEEARGSGTGKRLVEAMIAALEALGAPRIVLSTMIRNEAAQRLFASCGFRATMVEMTRDRA